MSDSEELPSATIVVEQAQPADEVEILPSGGLGARINLVPQDNDYRAGNYDDEPDSSTQDATSFIDGHDQPQRRFSDLNTTDARNNMLNINFGGEYKKPKKQKALDYKLRRHPHTDQMKPYPVLSTPTGRHTLFGASRLCFKNHSALMQYGPGIVHYFKWLKWIGVVFLIISFLQSPVVLFNIYGGEYFSDSLLPLAETTIGNLGITSLNLTVNDVVLLNDTSQLQVDNTTFYRLRLPLFCDDGETKFFNSTGTEFNYCKIEQSTLLILYAFIDAICMLILYFAINISKAHELRETRRYDDKVLKIEDYSIEVKNLPPDCTAEHLKDHFEKLIGSTVHDVQVVESTNSAIEKCIIRGRMLKQLARKDATVKSYKMKGFKESKIANAQKSFDKLYDKIQKLDVKAADDVVDPKSLLAFVTFESQSAYKHCMKMYKVIHICKQDEVLMLDGKQPLKITQAPPASSLLWENQEYSARNRFGRAFLASLLLLCILAITASISYIADEYKAFDEIAEISGSVKNLNDICDGVYSGMNYTVATDLAVSVPEPNGLECLCKNELVSPIKLFPNNNNELFASGGPCQQFLNDFGIDIGIKSGVSVITLLLNAVITLILFAVSDFMKFPSIIEREATVMKRLFVVTFINTAFIVLLVNTDLSRLFGTNIDNDFIKSGQFEDFSAGWYNKVGVEIILVAILNIFAPHIGQIIRATVHKVQRFYKRPVSQSQLNDLYLGPEFMLSIRYAQVLMMIAFLLMYSSGMPALYYIVLVSIFVTYWVDKYFFFRICRTPPHYTTQLGSWANHMIEWAIVLHLIVGMWMFTCPLLFPQTESEKQNAVLDSISQNTVIPLAFVNGTSVDNPFIEDVLNRFTSERVIPMLLVLVFVLAVKILRRTAVFFKVLQACLGFIFKMFKRCCSNNLFEQLLNEDDLDAHKKRPKFAEALESHQLSGIKTYSILSNPKYAQDLQVGGHHAGDEDFSKKVIHTNNVFDALGLNKKKNPRKSINPRFSTSSSKSNKSTKSTKSAKSTKSTEGATADASVTPAQEVVIRVDMDDTADADDKVEEQESVVDEEQVADEEQVEE